VLDVLNNYNEEPEDFLKENRARMFRQSPAVPKQSLTQPPEPLFSEKDLCSTQAQKARSWPGRNSLERRPAAMM
jgi:hypothetical protein